MDVRVVIQGNTSKYLCQALVLHKQIFLQLFNKLLGEYLLVYRGPGFLTVAAYDLAPPPPNPPPTLPSLMTEEVVGERAKLYDIKKDWSPINHSILSDNAHIAEARFVCDTYKGR